MQPTNLNFYRSYKVVFWTLPIVMFVLLYLQAFGPESLIPGGSATHDHLSAPEMYYEKDTHEDYIGAEPASSSTASSTSSRAASSTSSRAASSTSSRAASSSTASSTPSSTASSTSSSSTSSSSTPFSTAVENLHVDMSYVKEMENLTHLIPFDARKLKTILIWNNGYGEYQEGLRSSGDAQELLTVGCPEPNCVVVSNRTFKPQHKFDAIIFHFRATTLEDLPTSRSLNQRWIFKEVEPASYVYQWPHLYNDLFNWTMTYKLNSDIPVPYGMVTKKTASERTSYLEAEVNRSPLNKTKLVAWFVSNCRSHSGREHLVETLQKYIPVDVYGKCGSLECPRNTSDLCYDMLETDYKFYLSFENALCNDYVTEKLFSVLRYRVVPVVFGQADYKAIAPPKSFIDVFDFRSVQHLAEYLLYLSTNDAAYNEYFSWKADYTITDTYALRAAYICHICYKLHHDTKPKVYRDLDKWFMSDSSCRRQKNHATSLDSVSAEQLLDKLKLYIKKFGLKNS